MYRWGRAKKLMVVRGRARTPPWELCLSTSLSVKCRRFPMLVSAADGAAGVQQELEEAPPTNPHSRQPFCGQ